VVEVDLDLARLRLADRAPQVRRDDDLAEIAKQLRRGEVLDRDHAVVDRDREPDGPAALLAAIECGDAVTKAIGLGAATLDGRRMAVAGERDQADQ